MKTTSAIKIEKFRAKVGPLIDIRSPKEFSHGHWPSAINLPLFSDEEREEVGKAYKQEGRHKAILLGVKFTGPKLERIINTLFDISQKNKGPNSKFSTNLIRIYCWRGGMRSSAISWLANLYGLKSTRLYGGYKAYRNWVLKQFEKKWKLQLLGGRTGTGKTEILKALERIGESVIDLEDLANHRGSSFGGIGKGQQPSNEQYENNLAETLKSLLEKSDRRIWLEDESPNLGKCRIPKGLFDQMKKAPVIEITRSYKERINRLVNIYSIYKKEDLEAATIRIQRRLGPQRTTQALEAIKNRKWENACHAFLDYYDRCYEHGLLKANHRKIVDITDLTSDQAAEKLLDPQIT